MTRLTLETLATFGACKTGTALQLPGTATFNDDVFFVFPELDFCRWHRKGIEQHHRSIHSGTPVQDNAPKTTNTQQSAGFLLHVIVSGALPRQNKSRHTFKIQA